MAMDTTRAREQLGWTPAYDSRETLESLVAARRRQAE
jgi:nucleoside-diphosphate-sugar epimerase